MAKKNAAPTKSEILATISKDTGLAKKQVSDVFESLGGVVKKSLKGSGLFTLPGLLKMKVVKKPATKAREGINPFTGEKMTFKAKPASSVSASVFRAAWRRDFLSTGVLPSKRRGERFIAPILRSSDRDV